MTDVNTRAETVERPCPNCGHSMNGCSGLRNFGSYTTHDTAYCLRYLRNDRDDQAAEIGILRTEKHADAEAIGSQAAEIERLWAALVAMVYETTHLSPLERDGSHWCKISKDALYDARAAIAQEAQTDE